jgi:hypothetical protein
MTISGLLTGRFYLFLLKNDLDQDRIEPFQRNLIQVLNQNPEFKNDESKSISIKTLSEFPFPIYQENLPIFVKDTVLLYLDHCNPLIRQSVA